MADIKWSSFPSTTGTTAGDSVVGLHSGANERFLVSSTPSASGIAVWDANSNLSANSTINGYATTATAAGTTTLTVASKYQQYFTGSTTQTVVMPNTSTLALGQSYLLVNNSSGNVTVNASDASLILTMTPNTVVIVTCISIGVTTNAAWNIEYQLNQLAPTSSNINLSYTGNNQSPITSVYYGSTYILNNFYQNILIANMSPAALVGPAAIDFGNIAIIGQSAINIVSSALTSLTANSLLAFMSSFVLVLTPLLTTISMPLLIQIAGAGFTIISANSLVSLSLPSAIIINGLTFTSATSMTTVSLPSLTVMAGSIIGTLNALTSFTLSSLVNLGGSYSLTSNVLTTLNIPNLQTIGVIATNTAGNFAPSGTLLDTINLPALISVNGTFSPTLAALTTLTVTSLQTVIGAFGLTAATLTTLSLPALTTLGAGFSPVCALATTVTLTLLANVTGTFVPSFAALTALSLPALVSISGLLTITAANLVTFSMGSTLKSIGGNFTMTGMKLDQASVDGILVSLAALDGTNGTTAYSSRTINLSGGTSSAPSVTGLAARTVLLARSCTVTTN